MANKNNSPRDNAKPTGNMSAEESHEYAQQFQKENFGASINVGGGRDDAADAEATTQETSQRAQNSDQQRSPAGNIKHRAGGDSDSDKDLG